MEIGTPHVLFAWSDIQEYRAIPTVDYRFTKAKQVLCVRYKQGRTPPPTLKKQPTALQYVGSISTF